VIINLLSPAFGGEKDKYFNYSPKTHYIIYWKIIMPKKILTEEIVKLITKVFEEKVPFNRIIGMKLEEMELGHSKISFEMKDELIGNFALGILHGGVISATLDVAGGLTAFLGVLGTMKGKSYEEKAVRFAKIGTIDLRVDYLRPGKGKLFTASGSVLRTGNRVAVTRMELHNEEDLLIALGTGTYIVG
jgi:uncharacterized protein (TIGR00369 family)